MRYRNEPFRRYSPYSGRARIKTKELYHKVRQHPKPLSVARFITHNMSNQPLEVAIIGAGIVGLTCALALEKEGVKVEIYEAAVSPQ